MKEYPRTRSPLEALYCARHQGKPTRICDLTVSPLSALCFASEDAEDDENGVVYILDKGQSIGTNSVEIRLFSTILTGDSQLNEATAETLWDILTRNYIIAHKDIIHSNERSFRQGGTGLLFGKSLICTVDLKLLFLMESQKI
jgi:hypothetical protein